MDKKERIYRHCFIELKMTSKVANLFHIHAPKVKEFDQSWDRNLSICEKGAISKAAPNSARATSPFFPIAIVLRLVESHSFSTTRTLFCIGQQPTSAHHSMHAFKSFVISVCTIFRVGAKLPSCTPFKTGRFCGKIVRGALGLPARFSSRQTVPLFTTILLIELYNYSGGI